LTVFIRGYIDFNTTNRVKLVITDTGAIMPELLDMSREKAENYEDFVTTGDIAAS
jgi:hypothetical protein